MILICDDDTTVRTSLTLVLKRAGYEVATAANQQEAIDFVRHTCPQLILMDMNYSNTTTGEEGLELLAKVRVFCPAVPVILITAWGSINLAVQGIRAGAFDFITKPWNNLALLKTIETAIQLRDSEEKNPDPKNGKTERTDRFDKIIGRSPLLQQVLNTISRISQTNAPVLITGESGTGKELIAEAIHENSGRQGKPFVKVNLGGISQSLFESEMFGHKQGAFTDAQTFEPLGESKPRQVDTRIICATNKNLPEMVAQGTFREDLFYRINLITIQMPALRERPEDIPLLVEYFARKQAEQNNLPEAEISQEAFGYLKKLPFHGNIRELKNLVERTILISGKDVITDIDFKQQYIEVPASQPAGGNTILSLEMVERNMIQKAVELYGCNHSRIAAALGLSRQTLYRRLEKYDIKLPE